MRELFKEHTFEAKVRDVYDFIMEHDVEEVEYENYPDFYCCCELFRIYKRKNISSHKGKPIYGIGINVNVGLENNVDIEWMGRKKRLLK